jgi:two-component system cell cycle sensor histidine kinase/response regulator CckA
MKIPDGMKASGSCKFQPLLIVDSIFKEMLISFDLLVAKAELIDYLPFSFYITYCINQIWRTAMSDRNRIFILILIMALSSLLVAGITIISLYNAAINEEKERLVETVQSQARLIEAVARFAAIHIGSDFSGGARAATLSQIIAAHKNYEQSGRTTEYTLAQKKGNAINFLLRHRHGGLEQPKPVDFASKLAEPMRQALLGRSGTIVGIDYRGEKVLAAHEPVSEIGLGIVAKIDLSEIRAPFVKAGIIAAIFSVLVILIGVTLFLRVSNPMIKLLEEHNTELEVANKNLINEIDERNRAEDALRESEAKYRLLVENANDAIFILQNGQIKFFNQQAKEIGEILEVEFAKLPFAQYIHPDDRDMVIDRHLRQIKGDKLPNTHSFRLVGRDGQVIWVELNAVQINWDDEPATLNFLRDITLQRRMEQQLQLSQKMEAVGTLAGGIAHDFNNLLMGIQGRTSLMLLDTDPSHAYFEHLKAIESYVVRAEKLTKQLLGFARGEKYEVKPTDLNKIIASSSQMFARTKKEITVHKKYQAKLWVGEVDQSQIDQVLLNIFVNAWQAMNGGGNLYIQTENAILDDNFVRAYGVQPGEYIQISITDTGIGMDEETAKRVFDPFFTTKEKERGTGLGLASAYGIIKNHDGIITAESTPGQGATFKIYLPASDKPVTDEQRGDQKFLVGSETILLVDDEEMIIGVGSALLNKMGYEVLIAHRGREAIDIFKQNKKRVAIVILDLIMPEMSGGEVYQNLKEIDPNVKVLLSSGYSLNGQAAEILRRGCNGFIQKPFKTNELSNKIREIIAA